MTRNCQFTEYPELKFTEEEVQAKKDDKLLKDTLERAYIDPGFRENDDVRDLLKASMDHIVQSLDEDNWMYDQQDKVK